MMQRREKGTGTIYQRENGKWIGRVAVGRGANGKNQYKCFSDHARFERSFYRLLKNCGIEQTGVHSLRHTFASVLFSQNVDIKTISTLLSHASIKITMDTYVHLMSDTGEQAVEKLNAAI